MVQLKRITEGNPFVDYPALRDIFAGDRAAYVEADTVADLAATHDRYSNHVYVVVTEAGNAVGLTGFFCPEADDGRSYLGLRWHGIVPAHRGQGHSLAAFKAVVELAKERYPAAKSMLEYVPCADADKTARLTAYFESLGFELFGERMDAKEFPVGINLPTDSGEWQVMKFSLRVQEPVCWLRNGLI